MKISMGISNGNEIGKIFYPQRFPYPWKFDGYGYGYGDGYENSSQMIAYGAANILVKISLDEGLDQVVLIVYRNLIGMVVLAPFAYAFERTKRPSLSFSVLLKIFVLAGVGSTINQNVHYLGLGFTSATVSAAMSNIIPSFTFIVAIVLRMEKVDIRSTKGLAKIIGTILCIGGALTFTFWKGGYMSKGFVRHPLVHIKGAGLRHHKHWVIGSLLVLIGQAAWGGWIILQAIVFKSYPAGLSLNVLSFFFGAMQSSIIALIVDRKPESWKLGWNVQLLTIIYNGVITTALMYCIQTWCISEKGPVFAAMFYPLGLLFVGVFSAIVFAERLYLGSLVGATFIVIGLYCVLWGKTKDKSSGNTDCEKEMSCNETSGSCNPPKKEIYVDAIYDDSITVPNAIREKSTCISLESGFISDKCSNCEHKEPCNEAKTSNNHQKLEIRHFALVFLNIKPISILEAFNYAMIAYGCSSILVKISLDEGLNQVVLIVYRNLIGMVVLAPFAYAFERTNHPSLSFSILIKIFVLAGVGSTINQNVHYLGLGLTSATVSAAMSNIIPSFTFIMAVALRMEKVNIRSAKGIAKIIGSLLVLIGQAAWGGWITLQAIFFKDYPAGVSLNVLTCFFGAIQCFVIAVIVDRNPESWKLGWNIQLLTIIYNGVITSALLYWIQTWCIREKGPVFVAMFSPLGLLFVGVFSAVVFAERLYLGSLVGAILIVTGLYCVLWGKSKDNSTINTDSEKGQGKDRPGQGKARQGMGKARPGQGKARQGMGKARPRHGQGKARVRQGKARASWGNGLTSTIRGGGLSPRGGMSNSDKEGLEHALGTMPRRRPTDNGPATPSRWDSTPSPGLAPNVPGHGQALRDAVPVPKRSMNHVP
ncbi:hypothetical protein Sjap_005817 [Stephania japonica]|uniref:EamA domain-containing protein n=1 Tax=Stephania japonica TaxID=461633 RepID=A0AAP0PKG7_9MAGN